MSIKIYKNPNGDSRTAPSDVTFEQFQQANDMHRQDVVNVSNQLAFALMNKARNHDYTKKTEERMFYDNFLSTMNDGTDFVNDEWYQLHIDREKHHLLSKCHEDVTLLDVLEMIVDCVCAGKARSGDVRGLEINDDILKLAINNTVKMVNNMTECEDLKLL